MKLETKELFILHSLRPLLNPEDISDQFILFSLTESESLLLKHLVKILPKFYNSKKTGWTPLEDLVINCTYKDLKDKISIKSYYRAKDGLISKRIVFWNKDYGYMLNHSVIHLPQHTTVRLYLRKEYNRLVKKYKTT